MCALVFLTHRLTQPKAWYNTVSVKIAYLLSWSRNSWKCFWYNYSWFRFSYFVFTKPVATTLKNLILWFSVLKHRSTVFKVTTVASVNKHAVWNACMKPEAHRSIHVRSQERSCRIYGERSGKGTGLSPSTRLSTVTVHHNCTFTFYSSTADACRPTLILAIDSVVKYKISSVAASVYYGNHWSCISWASRLRYMALQFISLKLFGLHLKNFLRYFQHKISNAFSIYLMVLLR